MGRLDMRRVEVDARLHLLNDTVQLAQRGDITPSAAADVVERLAPSLVEQLRAGDDSDPTLPSWLDREVRRLTRTARPT